MIILVAIVISAMLAFISWLYEKNVCSENEFFVICVIMQILSVIAIIGMFIVVGLNNMTYDGQKKTFDEQYKSLIYKSQCEETRDEFGVINKKYIDEIQEWNMDVVKYKAYHDNIWIGVFYPDYYIDCKTIDLNTIKMKK